MFLTVLRKVIWFTVIGWVALLPIGPVTAVVGTILPFALLGALVWLVWYGLNHAVERFRQPAVREKLRADRVMPAIGQGARVVGREAGRVFQAGLHRCREAVPVLRATTPAIGDKMRTFLRATARLLVEISCGALLGGLLAWFAVDPAEQTVAIGALLGAAMGFVVGGPKREPARELAVGD
jgi:hypothetical protein